MKITVYHKREGNGRVPPPASHRGTRGFHPENGRFKCWVYRHFSVSHIILFLNYLRKSVIRVPIFVLGMVGCQKTHPASNPTETSHTEKASPRPVVPNPPPSVPELPDSLEKRQPIDDIYPLPQDPEKAKRFQAERLAANREVTVEAFNRTRTHRVWTRTARAVRHRCAVVFLIRCGAGAWQPDGP